jgi:catechol-2,3-dioxygenase
MNAVYKRAVPYAEDALNLPVENVETAIPYYETILGFHLVSRKMAAIQARKAASLR